MSIAYSAVFFYLIVVPPTGTTQVENVLGRVLPYQDGCCRIGVGATVSGADQDGAAVSGAVSGWVLPYRDGCWYIGVGATVSGAVSGWCCRIGMGAGMLG